MKRFLVGYVIFSVFLLILVYGITFFQETQKRSNQVLFNLVTSAVDSRNFDDYIRYQSSYYRHIGDFQSDFYQISLYSIYSTRSDHLYHQFVVFILPTEQVPYAEKLQDSQDQTRMILWDVQNERLLLDTASAKEYQDIAVSYGIGYLGFYYYTQDVTESMTFELTLYDYTGRVFFQDVHHVKHVLSMEEDFLFKPGFTQDQIEALLDINRYLIKPMLINIALFLTVDILIGGVLILFLNKKKQ